MSGVLVVALDSGGFLGAFSSVAVAKSCLERFAKALPGWRAVLVPIACAEPIQPGEQVAALFVPGAWGEVPWALGSPEKIGELARAVAAVQGESAGEASEMALDSLAPLARARLEPLLIPRGEADEAVKKLESLLVGQREDAEASNFWSLASQTCLAVASLAGNCQVDYCGEPPAADNSAEEARSASPDDVAEEARSASPDDVAEEARSASPGDVAEGSEGSASSDDVAEGSEDSSAESDEEGEFVQISSSSSAAV